MKRPTLEVEDLSERSIAPRNPPTLTLVTPERKFIVTLSADTSGARLKEELCSWDALVERARDQARAVRRLLRSKSAEATRLDMRLGHLRIEKSPNSGARRKRFSMGDVRRALRGEVRT